MKKELILYANYLVLELEHKKNASDNETKVKFLSIIEDIHKEVIPDIQNIKSEKYIFEYGEYLQEFALTHNIKLEPFQKMEWKHSYRKIIIDELI